MKKTLRKIVLTLISAAIALGFTASLPQPIQADPPPWAPAHGYHKKHKHKKKVVYKYIYYPAQQVYYSPVRGGYYYPYNSGWRFSINLPSTIRLGRSVSIDLAGPRPYVYHPTVIQTYPVVVVP